MKMKRIVWIAVCLLLAGLAGWLGSAYLRDQRLHSRPPGAEKMRQPAPGGVQSATVWLPRLDGLGATISQPYQVWIESQQAHSERGLVLEADKTDAIVLKWRSPVLLEVCYDAARIHYFKNYFVMVSRKDGLPQIHTVEIVLKRVGKINECA